MKRFFRTIGRCKEKMISLIPDILVLAGVLLIVYGVNLINQPAAWITAGTLVIALAVIWSKGYSEGDDNT